MAKGIWTTWAEVAGEVGTTEQLAQRLFRPEGQSDMMELWVRL